MSRAVKDTPVLTGKHARQFLADVTSNENIPEPRENYLRAKVTYARIQAATFKATVAAYRLMLLVQKNG